MLILRFSGPSFSRATVVFVRATFLSQTAAFHVFADSLRYGSVHDHNSKLNYY